MQNPKFQIPACGRQAKQVPNFNFQMTETISLGILTIGTYWGFSP
jgi:hypothetical protein